MLPTVLLAPDAAQLLALKEVFKLPYKYSFFQASLALPLWLVPLGIVLLGHALSVVWRGRSVWLVLDLIALLAMVWGAWMALRPFLPYVALKAAMFGFLWIVAWVFIGLVVAGAVQLTVGRVDLRRAHRSLSAALWAVLAVAVGALLGWSTWVRSATPRDVHRVDRVAVASGEWIAITGPSDGRLDYLPRFILNVTYGRWLRIDSGPRWSGANVWFSGDGRRAFWGRRSLAGELDLMYVNLEHGEVEPNNLGLAMAERWSRMAVSHDGDRIAVVEERTTAVYDVETGDQLAAVVISGEFEPDYCWFDGPDAVVISASTPWVWVGFNEAEYRSTEYRFDVASKTLIHGDEKDETYPRRNAAGATATQRRRHVKRVKTDTGDTLALVDAESGEVVADLGETRSWWDVRDVGNGRFFVLRRLIHESVVDFFDADGVRLQRIEVGGDSALSFAGEVAPGRLMLGAKVWESDENRFVRYQTSIVNTETGVAETTIDGFYPLQGRHGREIEAVGSGAWQVG